MTLVDTRTLVDFLHHEQTPQTALLDRILSTERVIIGDLVYYELMRGFRRDSDYQLALSVLQALEQQPLSTPQSVAAGIEHYRFLRNSCDSTPPTTTVLLAAHCVLEGLPLLFTDPAFEPMVTRRGLIDRLAVD